MHPRGPSCLRVRYTATLSPVEEKRLNTLIWGSRRLSSPQNALPENQAVTVLHNRICPEGQVNLPHHQQGRYRWALRNLMKSTRATLQPEDSTGGCTVLPQTRVVKTCRVAENGDFDRRYNRHYWSDVGKGSDSQTQLLKTLQDVLRRQNRVRNDQQMQENEKKILRAVVIKPPECLQYTVIQ